MTEMAATREPPTPPIPADDGVRQPTIAVPDDPALRHIAMVGDTYTILLAGGDTAGRFALIDMLVPSGAGPPPHRHDFEEAFHVLEGEIEVSFRGEPTTLRTGETANIPALALHAFRNATETPVRLLCTVAPAGLEEFFAEVGDPVASRTAPAPTLDEDARAARMQKGLALAAKYRVDPSPPS